MYKGRGEQQERTPAIEQIKRDDSPRYYRADPALTAAVNVAVLLGQPLLVTGRPGSGKTQLAHSIAWEWRLGDSALQFNTKSTSAARDLFYTYDTLGRFQATYNKDISSDPLSFIHYNALGRAILFANPREAVAHVLPPGMEHPGKPQRSVVLIDEIDKAPRDFPNDLLDEIDSKRFRIPELQDAEVRATAEFSPIVVITSNSEKNLPDAFLRRCIYHHIAPPTREELQRIVADRVKGLALGESTGVDDAIDLFMRLRDDHSGLSKKPSTAELIGWLSALKQRNVDFRQKLKKSRAAVDDTLGVLVKLFDDLDPAKKVVEAWAK